VQNGRFGCDGSIDLVCSIAAVEEIVLMNRRKGPSADDT